MKITKVTAIALCLLGTPALAGQPVFTFNINESLASRSFLNVGTASEDGCDKRDDVFTFDTNSKTYVQNFRLSNETNDETCLELNYDWNYSYGLKTEGFEVVTAGGNPVDYRIELSNVWRVLKNKMWGGESWGNYNERLLRLPGSAPFQIGTEYHKTTFIGVENVTVPAGEFKDCFVIEDLVNWGDGPITRIYYFCEETGVARFVAPESGTDWQLQSYTTN